MSDPRFIAALSHDDSLPMTDTARDQWVKDLQNPLRYGLLPLLRVTQTLLLHVVYYLKRLIPIQFSAHGFLQWQINFFMKHFVTPEANYLILRHMWVESQILNFIIDNSRLGKNVDPVELYPHQIDELMEHSFVTHDRELFRVLAELGSTREESWPVAPDELDYSAISPIEMTFDHETKKWCQFIDFETAHELFKVTFCFLLKAEEYEAALNSLQFDQSMCRRVARITGHMDLESLAYNRYPMVLHHTNAVSERFVYHGVSLEHLHAFLIEEAAQRAPDSGASSQSTDGNADEDA